MAKTKPTYLEKRLKKVMSDAIIMNLSYTPVKYIQMRRRIMQIVVVVVQYLYRWLSGMLHSTHIYFTLNH